MAQNTNKGTIMDKGSMKNGYLEREKEMRLYGTLNKEVMRRNFFLDSYPSPLPQSHYASERRSEYSKDELIRLYNYIGKH